MLEWDDNNVHITMAGTTFKPSRSLPNNPQLDGLRVGDKIVMNKIISLIVFVMMFCTLIVVHASAAEPIYDAGLYDFESNWQLIRGTVTDDYEQIYDTNEKYSGGRSIRFSNTTDFESDNGKVLRMNTSSNQRINVKPLTEYTISVWVKTIDFQRLDPNNNSSGAYLDLIGYNADGNISMSDNITLIVVPEGTTDESINNGWKHISANITVNENTEYLRIDPRFRNSVGIVWFDNITAELKIYAEHDYYIDATLSTVTVRKNNDKDYETPILIKALYSKEGSLIEIKVLEVDNSLNKGETQVFTDRFKNSTDGNMVKVFIWDDLISMLPLSRVLTWVDDSRVIKNGLIVYEAEDMRLNNDDITIIQDIDASSGIAIKTSALSMADNPAMVENITMGLELEAPSEETGIYAIWIRVKTISLGNDSVFVKYTGLSNYLIDSGWASQDYYWRKIAIININEGLFRIDFKYREIGFILDKIIMTKDMSFEPTGIDDVPEIPEDGYDENPLYPLPEVNPPEGHPRIFVTSEMLPQIKENIKSDVLSSIYDSVERYAQEELDCVLPEVSSANNYSQGLIYKIQSRAFMYLIGEVNIEHAEQTIKYMRDFYDSLIWDTTTGDITRRMGTTIAASAMVYDWCYDALTDDDKEHLISSMKATAALMEIGYPPTKLSAFIGHGGEGELFYYQLLGGIATYDEDPEMYNLAAGRLFEEYFESREYFNESGNHPEGGFYGMIRYQWEALCQVIFERMGYPDVMGGEMGKPAVKWVYQRLPYGLWIKDGDTPPAYSETGHSYANDDMPLLLYAAVLTKDPYIQSEYIKQLSLRDYKGGSTVYDNGIHTLLLLDPSLEIEYMDEKPLTHVSTYPLSSMTARTSWQSGIEGETAYVFMKAQEKLTDNHNHADIGNFLIYYKGNLAINGGLYHGVNGSYGSNHHINYNQRTISKNCMTVYDPNEIFSTNLESETAQVLANDGGQRYRISVGSFEKYLEMEDQAATKGVYVGPNEITPEFSYIKTDLAKAYSDKVSEYTRSMVAMNLFNDDYPLAFVCFDNMQTSNKDFKKTWNLQSVNEPEISGNTTIIKRNEYGFTGKLVNKTLLPASGQFTITPVGGEGMESYVDGTNYSNPDRLGQVNEQGDWRIEISPTNASQEDIFLNAMYVTDTQKNLPELPMYYEDTSNFAGVTVQDRVVLFAKLRNNVSSQFNLTVRNNGYDKMSVLITDIDTGKWAVSGESTSFVTEVKEGENALYINVAPGTYTITPESDMTEVDVFTYPIVDTPKVGDFWVYNTTTSLFHYNDKPSRLVDGVPYVAAKTFFEKLGATVTWNSNDGSTSISFTDSIAIIKENTKEYTLNGNMSELSYEPFIEDGALYVYPLDFQDIVSYIFMYDPIVKILKMTTIDKSFVHPGLLHNIDDLNLMKEMVALNKQPWKTGWEDLQATHVAALSWQPNPWETVNRDAYNTNDYGATHMNRDAQAAYAHALQWVITDDITYAQKSIEILNVWSGTLTEITGQDAQLLAGITGSKFLNAAEIIRYTDTGWNEEDIVMFENMMLNVFYPLIENFRPYSNGNWDTSMINTMMGIGVFCNRRDIFNKAVDYFYNGEGNGAITNYIFPTGQCQESGRDQAHVQLGLGYLVSACEIGWKQGLDMYGAYGNRLAIGYEYTAKYNLGFDELPYEPVYAPVYYPNISPISRGAFRMVYERVYNHYKNRKGMDMPYTEAVINKIAPEFYQIDHETWGTLTAATVERAMPDKFSYGYDEMDVSARQITLFSPYSWSNSPHYGYTGTGYAMMRKGNFLQWNVNMPSTANRQIAFRYANPGSLDGPMRIIVNGDTIIENFAFEPTGGTADYIKKSIITQLNQGNNTIRIEMMDLSDGLNPGIQFDKMDINEIAVTEPILEYPNGQPVRIVSAEDNIVVKSTITNITNGPLSVKLVIEVYSTNDELKETAYGQNYSINKGSSIGLSNQVYVPADVNHGYIKVFLFDGTSQNLIGEVIRF